MDEQFDWVEGPESEMDEQLAWVYEPGEEFYEPEFYEPEGGYDKAFKEGALAGDAVVDIYDEFDRASSQFPPFNSAHEGFSVLKEEVDELWAEVKTKQGSRDLTNMRKEAVQVAAMALRFIVDICDGQREQR